MVSFNKHGSLCLSSSITIGEGAVDHRFEEATGFGVSAGKLRRQAIAHHHQFVRFGDDTVLFSKGRKGHQEITKWF